MKDILINERYRVDRRIAEGGFGLVYSGTDLRSGESVAIKLQPVRGGGQVFREEVDICQALSGGIGVPSIRWFGYEGDFSVMIQDLLGPSLQDLFEYCERRFSLKTVLLLAEQIISRLKFIHSKSYIHRDVKPENFLMGVGRLGNTVYAIDFGMAMSFDAMDTEEDMEDIHWHVPFGGTARYASLRNHTGLEQSWGDDLESVGYMLVYFAKGSLPWQGLQAESDAELSEKIMEMKASMSGEDLCRGLPDEFAEYIDYTRSLPYGRKPDYVRLQTRFRRLFTRMGFKYDKVFDWTERLFNELQDNHTNTAVPTRSAASSRESAS